MVLKFCQVYGNNVQLLLDHLAYTLCTNVFSGNGSLWRSCDPGERDICTSERRGNQMGRCIVVVV